MGGIPLIDILIVALDFIGPLRTLILLVLLQFNLLKLTDFLLEIGSCWLFVTQIFIAARIP
jgi:hypothetical protein